MINIQVSSIANEVYNGDMELWHNNIPLGWEGLPGHGSIGYVESLFGLAVQFTVPDDASSAPRIEQLIDASDLPGSGSYTVGIWYKGDGNLVIQDGGIDRLNTMVRSAQWKFREFTFYYGGSNNLLLTIGKKNATQTPYSYAYIDNVYIYKNDWYQNRKPLNTHHIKEFGNFIREIEDDLFEFKSDNMEFIIRNYGTDGSYFDTNDFTTYSERIFRFDIELEYESGVTKKMVMFSNNDTIKRVKHDAVDDIHISIYELSSLFKDNGWFLGRVVDSDDEVFFKYNTYDSSPDVVANNVPLETVLSNLESDILGLIKRHFIPVPLDNFEVNNEIDNSDNIISVGYKQKIDAEDDKEVVLDMFVSPTNRVFVLTCLYQDVSTTTPTIRIYEIENGSTLVELETPSLPSLPQLGLYSGISFIHDIDTDSTYSGGQEITFGILAIDGSNNSNLPTAYIRLYTNNAGTTSQEPTDDDIQLHYSRNILHGWVSISILLTAYFNNSGYSGTVLVDEISFRSYDPYRDNMLWLHYNQNTFSGNEGDYKLSDISLYPAPYAVRFNYASTLIAGIYRFPRNYSFIFEDAYPSDILKDICVSQDAIWYLEYDNPRITLNIKNRESDGRTQLFYENIAIREDSFVRRIKFQDLDGTIFRDDATRLSYYLAYYNSTYGGGRYEKEFEVKGHPTYVLGDIWEYGGQNYFIKRYEYDTYRYRTFLTLFQKGE